MPLAELRPPVPMLDADPDWIGPRELAAMRGGTVNAASCWIARRAREGCEVREVRSRRGRPERQIRRDLLT